MNIDKAIRHGYERKAASDSRALPTSTTVRAKSNGELNRKYNPQGYGLYFCLHDKSYFDPCHACKRGKAEATANFDRFLSI